MNHLQARALASLMENARPVKRHPEDEEPDIHVSLSVAQGVDDGNTYEARLWSVAAGFRFPDAFYLRGDGKVYVSDSERDRSRELGSVTWGPREVRGELSSFFRELHAHVIGEPMAAT